MANGTVSADPIRSYLDLGFSTGLKKDINENPYQNSSYQSLLQFQSQFEGVDAGSISAGVLTAPITTADPNSGAGLEPPNVGGGTGQGSGGATISGQAFKVGSGTQSVNMDVNGFYAGSDDFNTAPFSVDKSGHLIATDVTLSQYIHIGGAAADVNSGVTTINGGQITTGSITTNQIGAGQITSTNLASNSVDNTKIVGGTITATQIQNGTITTTQIAGGTITAANIQAGTLTSASGVFGAISANNITTGTLNASVVSVTNLNASNINTGTLNGVPVSGSQVTSGINGANINASSIAASKLSVGTLSAITANMGTITAGAITGGTIDGVTITGGTIRTSSSGHMVRLDGNVAQVSFYNGSTLINGLYQDYTGTYTGNGALCILGEAAVVAANGQNGDLAVDGNLSCGGTKPFDIKHPTLDGYRLRYIAIESPEVLLVARGTGDTPSLPQHFLDMSEEGSIQYVIGDDGNGGKNWVATSVRKGYSEFNPEYEGNHQTDYKGI